MTLFCYNLPASVDSWSFNIDKGNVDGVVFLDLRKLSTRSTIPSFYSNDIAMVLEILLTTALSPI